MPKLKIKNGQAEVDDIDLEWATSRPWHVGDTGYVKCYSGRPGGTPLRMHRLLMERVLGRALRADEYIDHINHDPRDNRRSNLRVATKAENTRNQRKQSKRCRSKYKGVGFKTDVRPSHNWMAYINADGQRIYIGNYDDEAEAAWMYDQWALALHGDFAYLNFEYLSTADDSALVESAR